MSVHIRVPVCPYCWRFSRQISQHHTGFLSLLKRPRMYCTDLHQVNTTPEEELWENTLYKYIPTERKNGFKLRNCVHTCHKKNHWPPNWGFMPTNKATRFSLSSICRSASYISWQALLCKACLDHVLSSQPWVPEELNIADDQNLRRDRRKFRSQTSDAMDKWKSRGGNSQRREEQKKEDHKRERVRRQKMQVREKVEKSRNTVFFQWFVAPGGLKVGSLKWRAQSHVVRWEM